MTLFAGVHAPSWSPEQSRQYLGAMGRLLSRRAGEPVSEYVRGGTMVVVAPLETQLGRVVCEANGATTALAGDPVILDAGAGPAAGLEWLHEEWRVGRVAEAARRCQGTFCAAHFRDDGTAALILDSIGLRPIYYARYRGAILFATAKRVLVGLDLLPKTIGLRGLFESNAFGSGLADRTEFSTIRRGLSGEVLLLGSDRLRRIRYFRLDQESASPADPEAQRQALHQAFSAAIDARLRNDRGCVAFLSGGLDSRAVVCQLRSRGAGVYTFNFAEPDSQDRVFGEAFAREVGTRHASLPRPEASWSLAMGEAWQSRGPDPDLAVERPGTVWSGDGGSIGLGYVKVGDQAVRSFRAGRPDEATRCLLRDWEPGNLPLRLLRRRIAHELRDAFARAIVHEAAHTAPLDAGRIPWIVLMEHDQRRHLDRHFEDLDIHRLEFHLPFFDQRMLRAAASANVDDLLGHHLYHRWLDLFPPVMRAIPWQTYPGHEPCPVPVDGSLSYQWAPPRARRRGPSDRALTRDASALVTAREFPDPLIDRRWLGALLGLHALHVRYLGHLLRPALALQRAWLVAEGRWEIETLSPSESP